MKEEISANISEGNNGISADYKQPSTQSQITRQPLLYVDVNLGPGL
jgi:hypothetical protein